MARVLPPVWVLGLTNATFGMFAGFAVVIMPQMLAAQHIPGGRIAAITAAVLSPGLWIFLLAPVLDVRFNRRTYALAFTLLAAVCLAWTVAHRTHPAMVESSMVAGYIAASLVQGAVGGWTGSLVQKKDDSRLGAWFTIANIGSGGIMIILAGEAIAALPPARAGVLLGALLLLPSLTYLSIPAPLPSRRPVRESFGKLFGEIAAVLKRREVLLALALLGLPSASFTLTNVLGGIGRDFAASEHMVSLLAGTGAMAAGIAGSLLLPPLARRLPLRLLYLGIGIAGALFTFFLLLLPHTPATFAVAITGENMFQSLAFSAASAIAFQVIGPANPLAATLFSLLIAAANLPIVYMGFVDGQAYARGGIPGALLADACISLTVCLLLGAPLIFLRRAARRSPSRASL